MNTENIKVGDIIKNYKELCTLLGEPEKTSNSKKAQLKEWERYFRYEREGHKYIIKEIFDTPKTKKLREGSRYADLIEKLINEHFMNHPADEWRITAMELYLYLGMINEDYKTIQKAQDDETRVQADNLNIQYITLCNFVSWSRNYLKETLYATLNSMKKRGIIKYTEEYVVIDADDKSRPATDSEEKKIRETEQLVLTEMNLENKQQMYRKRKQLQYYNKINRKLEREYGWKRIFKTLVIERCSLPEENIQMSGAETRTELNARITVSMQEQARKQLERARADAQKSNYTTEGLYFGIKGCNSKLHYQLVSSKTGCDYADEMEVLIDQYIRIRTVHSY